jgi:NTE family protein
VRDRIGQIASEVYAAHYAGPGRLRISAGALGRLVRADASPTNGELLSYLFFAPEFADALLSEGAADASTWLSRRHDDGIWQHGPLQPERRRSRRSRATQRPGVRRSAAAPAS